MTTTKPPASKKAGKGARAFKRVDWPAVKRDYRTSKFTQVELAAKHKLDPATLNRKIKKDLAIDSASWPQDLTEVVRQATNASLMADLVKSSVNDGQEQVNLTVKAAAELNKQVILSHRTRLRELNEAAEVARATLITLGGSVADVREAAVYVSALEASARTAKIVIEAERKAFGLDDESKPPESPIEKIERVIVRPQ